ncbi:MAG: 16S rRNA (cytidine(1402)-2'-O)-methyltransferase [Alphaproteobacteria bacterium]
MILNILDDQTRKDLPLCAGLYLVATPIGNLEDITIRAIRTLRGVDMIACEDKRTAQKLLTRYEVKKPLLSCHDHNEKQQVDKILGEIQSGKAVALISDAGMPLISDPGYILVRACHEKNVPVTVIPGASACLSGLILSGLPTHAFSYFGFLPSKKEARRKALENLKNLQTTLIFYEAPHRLEKTLTDMLDIFGEREAAVAREITKRFEEVQIGTIKKILTHYQENPPKGEIVIVVAPLVEAAVLDQGAVENLLRDLLGEKSLRDAVAEATELSGWQKKEVYQLALVVKNAL